MGNCALKPKVLSGAGAPAPEELKDSLLDDQKIDAAKSLSNLFRQDKAEKKTKEDEKITPDKILTTEDLKTSLADEKITPEKLPGTENLETVSAEAKSPATETKYPVTETKAPVGDEKVKNEEAVREEKVVDDVAVKEIESRGGGKRSSTMKEA